jgi:hypothetical protein
MNHEEEEKVEKKKKKVANCEMRCDASGEETGTMEIL